VNRNIKNFKIYFEINVFELVIEVKLSRLKGSHVCVRIHMLPMTEDYPTVFSVNESFIIIP